MIKIEKLSYSFPQKDLYNKISFELEEGQHCAFIGSSGSGKSTLTEIIMDPERYLFDGELVIDSHCRIGYVSQFLKQEKAGDATVFEYIGEEFIQLQGELAAICLELETSQEHELLLGKYQETLDAFSAIGGDDFENNIRKELNLADLGKLENRKVSELSGGEFKLVQVIREMLTSPELIIMDEPDVFLDFENLNSLKNLINSHKGMLLVITHNRYLLNHCFNKVIHLENKELQEFDGSYEEYNYSLLKRKIELQELALADEDELERNEALIEKLRNISSYNSEASRGKALNARVSIQERLKARQIKAPFAEIRQPEILLVAEDVPEDVVAISIKNYEVAFDEVLLSKVNVEITSTEKVALIGGNGTGKTTLLREIYNNNHEAITIHEGITMAYLSQVQGEMLKESNTILEEFFEAGFQTTQEIVEYIGKYGFHEEAVNQKIGLLSGGEKNLLQLAKISLQKANMLLLDEPTSHLDTYSQIALEKALEEYKGGILMISHDFYSIANCMDYVLLIENQTIRKLSAKKFRKMIYASHFDKDYLAIDQKKKEMETKIAIALRDKDFALAKGLSEELETIIKG